MRTILKIFLLISIYSIQADANEIIRYADIQDLKTNYQGCSVVIKCEQEKICLGTRFKLNIHLTNEDNNSFYFNPYFNKLIPSPARLAIYNEKKEYIGDLLAFEQGSRRGATSLDWVFIASNSYIGTEIKLRAGHVPRTQYSYGKLLPEGEYYLQLIYYYFFASLRPSDTETDLEAKKRYEMQFKENMDYRPLFRSNVIKVKYVKKEGT